MSAELEADWEKRLVVWAERRGWMCAKFTPRGDRAWPDRIFILPGGLHIWFECKRKNEEPTPLQYWRMGRMRDLGATVHWADNLHDAINTLGTY